MDTYKKIKYMKVQGASEIAILALEHLKKYAKKHGFGSSFTKECHRFIKVRPTAVVMHNVLTMAMKNRSLDEIGRLIDELKMARKNIAIYGRKLFSGRRKVVMTHCHSHEVIDLLKMNKGRVKYVYVKETRPRMQGALTARDLVKAHEKVRFITDSSAESYVKEVDIIIIGADALRIDGLVNKVGTLGLCILAKEFHKPVYVVADTFKLDSRKKIKIEQRSAKEVYSTVHDYGNISSLRSLKEIALLRSVKIMNPAFDITPWKYIHAVVTEKGIFKPNKIKTMINRMNKK
ncbi:MAG: hypothetical protein V1870_01350 [Candidatus Aenigmatarchaeota archaeon]